MDDIEKSQTWLNKAYIPKTMAEYFEYSLQLLFPVINLNTTAVVLPRGIILIHFNGFLSLKGSLKIKLERN